MAIPDTLPQWDETEVNAVEPDVTHKEEGWLAPGGIPEKPPFETFNYWMNLAYKWIAYFTTEARRLWQNQNTTHNMTSDVDYTLSADQNTYGKITITDTNPFLTASRNIFVDVSERSFIFQNNTVQSLVVRPTGGTGITVVAGAKVWAFCDGTNITTAADATAIASTAETQAGVNDTKAISPLKLHQSMIGSDSQQEWTNVLGSRSLGVTYTNTTGRPIEVNVSTTAGNSGSNCEIQLTVDGILVSHSDTTVSSTISKTSASAIIPNNSTYSVIGGGGDTLLIWAELR